MNLTACAAKFVASLIVSNGLYLAGNTESPQASLFSDYGIPLDNCAIAIAEINSGRAIQQEHLRNVTCSDVKSDAVFFDRKSRTLIADRKIFPGEYLGRFSIYNSQGLLAGTQATIVIQKGAVQISRPVTIASASRGNSAFVYAENTDVFVVRTSQLLIEENAHE